MLYKAFVSSTFEDLKDHRAFVIREIQKSGMSVDPMEYWTAAPGEPKVFSQERMKDCDLCVLLVARRRGYIPEDSDRSLTQLEYEAAMKHGIDVLVFMLDNSASWPPSFDELEKDPGIREWRDELSRKHGIEFFTEEPNSIAISSSLARWIQEINRRLPKGLLEVYTSLSTSSKGCGFIASNEGLVVSDTNVIGERTEVFVSLLDEKDLRPAKLVAKRPDLFLALLELPKSRYPALELTTKTVSP